MHYHQHDGCGPQSVDGIVKWALVQENDKRISFRKKLKEFMTSNQGPGVRSKVLGKAKPQVLVQWENNTPRNAFPHTFQARYHNLQGK